MQNELKKAADLLSGNSYTCVLCRGNSVFTDTRRGVRPLLELLQSGQDLRGFFAADKVVGKGAAFFYVLLGVQAVYAQVISAPAIDLLSRYGIELTYDTQVPAIENRNRTGLCPIETAVWDVDDPATALEKLYSTLWKICERNVPMPVDLITPQGANLLKSNAIPWTIYPRPQMKRDSYCNLNGYWDYAVTADEAFPADYPQQIRVPFCPESRLSGIAVHPKDGQYLYYRRNFRLPENFNRGKILLHIGAADQHLDCFVNGSAIGSHSGGYEAITFDITDALADENELILRCRDDLRDNALPYGKQTLKRGGMWYTPVSGIWQSVWLESVPETYIQKLHIENQGFGIHISVEPELSGKVIVPDVGEFALTGGAVSIVPDDPHLWSPEDPYLYDFSVVTEDDRIDSYFALRTLEIKQVDGYPRLCLNGKPYFFHGLLDQGYWPDGLFTPATPECYAEDILAMKKLGFNTLRKHIKVEPEEFYYQCDKLGMVVFQDMVNNGDYNFLRDTALPTVGLQKLNDRHLHRDQRVREIFLEGMRATVAQLKNHPSICYWTIFNEGWGQFDSDNVCAQFRKLDSTRFIDATSGWFRRSNTDVDSRHVYFKPVKLTAADKPLVLSEFGGYSFKPEGHVFNTEKTYGYGKFAEQSAFAEAVENLYLQQIVPAFHRGLCAAIYTQVSDVEDETNGLLSYDRKVCKLSAEGMLKIAEALKY